MDKFAVIGLRLIAIWAFLMALLHLQYFPSFYDSGLTEFSFFVAGGTIISFFLYLISALALALKAPSLSKYLISDFESESMSIDNYEKLSSILFATAGILIFFWSINTFLNSINSVNYFRTFRPDYLNARSEIIILILGGGIQMIFGLSLFIGGKNIAHWWYKFRNWS